MVAGLQPLHINNALAAFLCSATELSGVMLMSREEADLLQLQLATAQMILLAAKVIVLVLKLQE